MSEIYVKPIKDIISKKLINSKYDLTNTSNNQTMLEQYKLLVDSSHKAEERRNGSNNMFLAVNTLLISFLLRPSQLFEIQIKDLPLLVLLILVGVFISWDWFKVTVSYQRLNSINYYLIQAFEKLLPSSVFSLRAEIELEQDQQKPSNRANVILLKENLLPKIFVWFYLIYFIVVIIVFFRRIYSG